MITYLVLILLGTFITGAFSYYIAQRHYIMEVEHKLLTVGNIIKQDFIKPEKSINTVNLNEIALWYQEITNMRITFIDVSGNVQGDSAADYTVLENHADRPEVIQAFKTGKGVSIRYSDSVNEYLKYVALRIDSIEIEPLIVRLSISIGDTKVIRKQMMILIIISVLIAVIVASGLGLQFANRITRPINELINFSKNITKGNFKSHVRVEANDEIGMLACSFTEMQQQLDKTITKLREKNAEMKAMLDSMIGGVIAVDNKNRIILINNAAIEIFNINSEKIIGENILLVVRNQLFNQLLKKYYKDASRDKQQVTDIQVDEQHYKIYCSKIETKQEDKTSKIIGALIIIQDITNIRKLEQIRSDFVSNVTHEIKTPLTSIKGFTDTLKNGAIDDKEVAQHFLDIIDIEAERLSNLIGDILELSEIETMKKDIRIENYCLEDIVKEVLDVVTQSAAQKNIEIGYTLDSDIHLVRVNKDRLKQILLNLVDNGIKYNNEGGKVHIVCKRHYKMIEFQVKDNGIGICEQHIPRLFERFYRVDKGRSRNQGGTGLGLSIVKHIVNLYGGHLKVESEIGKGTVFIIQLPIAV